MERVAVRSARYQRNFLCLVLMSAGLSVLGYNQVVAQQAINPRQGAPSQRASSPVPVPMNGTFGPDAASPSSTAIAAARSRAANEIVPPREGDLSRVNGTREHRDGVLDLTPAPVARDGADTTSADTRSNDERAAFDEPPAGFDPLLFQIEDIDRSRPSLNRLPRRLADREPYDPVGVRIASFVFFPEIELGTRGTSNVFAEPNGSDDRSYELRPTARLVSNWNVHALELRGAADISSYDTFKSEDDRGYELEARGRLDVTRRTNLQGIVSRQFSQESRSAVDSLAFGDRPDITIDNATLALNHRFNRLSVQLRGGVSKFDYSGNVGAIDSDDAGNGALQVAQIRGSLSSDDRDYLETREAVRASWEFKPTLRVFGEVELVQRDYDQAAFTDNILRSSKGGRYRAGIDFGSTSDIIRGEISLGYGNHNPDANEFASIDGLIVDANLAYRFNGLTSLLLSARTDVTETTTARSAGIFEHQAGIELRHEFRHHLIGSASVQYTRRNLAGVLENESDLTLGLGLEYFINPSVVVFTDYDHTFSWSDFPNSD